MSGVADVVEEVSVALDKFRADHSKAVHDLKADLARERKEREDLELRMSRPGASATKRIDASPEHKAIGAFVKSDDMTELKAMSIGSDPDGGYLVLPHFSDSIMQVLRDQSPMRRLARVATITAGDAFEEPFDNSDVGATWVGETQSRPATTTAALGMLRVPVHEIYANQKVSQRLLDDSQHNIGAFVEGKIADKFARAEGETMVDGDGMLKPRGFTTYPTAATADASRAWGTFEHVVSGNASAITADGLIDLYWKLKAGYRQNATWLMSSATANAVDKLKDSNGAYLWRNGMQSGEPPSLLGRPVEFAETMPAIAANALPVAFGDFKRAYLIVDKAGVRMLRDPFTDKPHVLFYAYRRVGGDVSDFWSLKFLNISA